GAPPDIFRFGTRAQPILADLLGVGGRFGEALLQLGDARFERGIFARRQAARPRTREPGQIRSSHEKLLKIKCLNKKWGWIPENQDRARPGTDHMFRIQENIKAVGALLRAIGSPVFLYSEHVVCPRFTGLATTSLRRTESSS